MELRKIVASMAWDARNLIPHGPRHELDVLRRRRVVDSGADGVRQRPGARVVSHGLRPRRLTSRSGLVLRASLRAALFMAALAVPGLVCG